MTDFSQLFLYIPGIIIFLVGSGQVRRWMRMHRSGYCVDAVVFSCNHVVKKDKKDRVTYDYYNVTVEYMNPQTKHKERQAVIVQLHGISLFEGVLPAGINVAAADVFLPVQLVSDDRIVGKL